jgi:hypothetical protein
MSAQQWAVSIQAKPQFCQSSNTLEWPYLNDYVVAKCLIDNPVSLRYLYNFGSSAVARLIPCAFGADVGTQRFSSAFFLGDL